MAIRTKPARTGTPNWVDLGTSDVARSIEFYGSLFGWKATDQGEQYGHYHVFSLDGDMVGGLMGNPPGRPDGWMVYLAADDARATEQAISAAGGTVHSGAMHVGDQGTMLVAEDPAGAELGVWQAETNLGSALPGTGTPVWWECYTRDLGAAKSFYSQVFGVGFDMLSDTDEFRYAQLKVGDEVVGGMMDRSRDLPDGQSSYWQVYFGVEDVDAACARVLELGGEVLEPALDSPYGRLSYVKDSTGAGLMLMTPSR